MMILLAWHQQRRRLVPLLVRGQIRHDTASTDALTAGPELTSLSAFGWLPISGIRECNGQQPPAGLQITRCRRCRCAEVASVTTASE